VPLIVLPFSVSVPLLAEMVTFCPTFPFIQIPPALVFPVRFGWLLLVNVLSKTALSPAEGAVPVQLPFVLQVVLVAPVQILSVAKRGAAAITKTAAKASASSLWQQMACAARLELTEKNPTAQA